MTSLYSPGRNGVARVGHLDRRAKAEVRSALRTDTPAARFLSEPGIVKLALSPVDLAMRPIAKGRPAKAFKPPRLLAAGAALGAAN
jgi:hypothetical protein